MWVWERFLACHSSGQFHPPMPRRGAISISEIANQFNVRLGGDPVIMVVKKNGSVLRNLTRWAQIAESVGVPGKRYPTHRYW